MRRFHAQAVASRERSSNLNRYRHYCKEYPPMASSTIPEKFLDLLTVKKPLANIATTMPDGSPQVTPVWFDYTNGKIRINTARGRGKAKNLKVGSKVALAIVHPDNAYRYIGIRGPVFAEDEKKAEAHIDGV